MPDLITLDEFAAALGVTLTDSEATAVQVYISTISDFINEYVDVSFFRVTVTERHRANYYGEVKLTGPDVIVGAVTNVGSGQPCTYAAFDAVDTVFYLYPDEVVDVTYMHGYSDIPQDIKQLVLSGVVRATNFFPPSDLKVHQVGDVRDEYNRSGLFKTFSEEYAPLLLSKYTFDQFTLVNDPGVFPNYDNASISMDLLEEATPAPTLDSMVPYTATTVDEIVITITGQNWTEGAVVLADGDPVPSLLDVDAGSGTAYIGTSPGDQYITVRNPDDQVSNFYIFSRTPASTPAPTISNISPDNGEQFVEQWVTINGSNFDNNGVVFVDGAQVPTNLTSSTTGIFFLDDIAYPLGDVDVYVQNSDDQVSNTVQFTFTPGAAPGTEYTLWSGDSWSLSVGNGNNDGLKEVATRVVIDSIFQGRTIESIRYYKMPGVKQSHVANLYNWVGGSGGFPEDLPIAAATFEEVEDNYQGWVYATFEEPFVVPFGGGEYGVAYITGESPDYAYFAAAGYYASPGPITSGPLYSDIGAYRQTSDDQWATGGGNAFFGDLVFTESGDETSEFTLFGYGAFSPEGIDSDAGGLIDWRGGQFTFASDGFITGMKMWRSDAADPQTTATLRSAADPSIVLATATITDNGPDSWCTATFDEPFEVSAGEQYVIAHSLVGNSDYTTLQVPPVTSGPITLDFAYWNHVSNGPQAVLNGHYVVDPIFYTVYP